MHALILLLALLFSPAQQQTMTVRECLQQENPRMSTAFTGPTAFNEPQYDAQGRQVNLFDRPGVSWPDYADVLQNAEHRIMVTAETDTGNRPILILDYAGQVYVFMFMHRDNPNRRLPHEAKSVWHGVCLLRLS